MDYQKKLESVLSLIESKAVSFPKTLKKKHISYLSNVNAVSLIRSLSKGKERGVFIGMLVQEHAVQRLLNNYSTNECAFIISSNI